MTTAQPVSPAVTVTAEEVEAVIAELQAEKAQLSSGGFPITLGIELERARALIKASANRLTWFDAGETWARLTLARPGFFYPEL